VSVAATESDETQDSRGTGVTPSGESAPAESAGQVATDASTESQARALYRWVDSSGTVQFGEQPPEEYAASAVKVIDL
jgi:hypothetical protein